MSSGCASRAPPIARTERSRPVFVPRTYATNHIGLDSMCQLFKSFNGIDPVLFNVGETGPCYFPSRPVPSGFNELTPGSPGQNVENTLRVRWSCEKQDETGFHMIFRLPPSRYDFRVINPVPLIPPKAPIFPLWQNHALYRNTSKTPREPLGGV